LFAVIYATFSKIQKQSLNFQKANAFAFKSKLETGSNTIVGATALFFSIKASNL